MALKSMYGTEGGKYPGAEPKTFLENLDFWIASLGSKDYGPIFDAERALLVGDLKASRDIVSDAINDCERGDASIVAFLEPYEKLTDRVIQKISDGPDDVTRFGSLAITKHVATQILVFRKRAMRTI